MLDMDVHILRSLLGSPPALEIRRPSPNSFFEEAVLRATARHQYFFAATANLSGQAL
jgi:hypothetical protein